MVALLCFSFSVLSQEIGWEERLRNYLFCIAWVIKPELNQWFILLQTRGKEDDQPPALLYGVCQRSLLPHCLHAVVTQLHHSLANVACRHCRCC